MKDFVSGQCYLEVLKENAGIKLININWTRILKKKILNFMRKLNVNCMKVILFIQGSLKLP